MEKFKHRKLLMPSYFDSQLNYIQNSKNAYNGGYFAGTSQNKYYAKKQHKNHFYKYFKHLNRICSELLEFNLN